MRKVLVTGGAGFIGSNIVDALVRRGDQVRVLDNLSTGKLSNLEHLGGQVELIEADVADSAAVARAVAGVECVLHQAALASVPRSLEQPLDTNSACVTGTLVLLDQAARAGVRRVVYAGSSAAYGDQPTVSKRETDLLLPISPYGAAKAAAELYCQAFAAMGRIETVTLRYFNVFGPRQDPHSEYSAVIPRFITLLLAGERPTIYGDGLQSRDFTFVGDVVAGNLLAADAPNVSGRVLNLAAGRTINLRQLIEVLNRLLGTNIEPQFAPPRAGDVRESLADITQARKLLGYEAQVSFEEGLRRSIDYYRSIVAK